VVPALFFGKRIVLPVRDRVRSFPASERRAEFTSFENVRDVTVRNGCLELTLADTPAVLGWGNCFGRLDPSLIPDMWPGGVTIRIVFETPVPGTDWTARLWQDGAPLEQRVTASPENAGATELTFPLLRGAGPSPDGIEFTVKGKKGTRLRIERIELRQPFSEGVCRFEFDLPKTAKIWRAIADVGSANERHWYGAAAMTSELRINGRRVERHGALYLYHTAPADIAPYLRPGRNCVGFRGVRVGAAPFLYFQARIVLEDGRVIEVATGSGWKAAYRAAAGWDRPGFDDADWGPAKLGPAPDPHIRDGAGRLGLPAWSGRLLVRNPEGGELFFDRDRAMVVEVGMPRGLRTRRPVLEYVLKKADETGRLAAALERGTVAEFAETGDSLTTRINLGRHEHGVYALALRLAAADGGVIEERPCEPLVVVRRVGSRRIAGVNYTEGLDLELEDTVDFTDPKDPHPWIEAAAPPRRGQPARKVVAPKVVRRHGLIYRETSDARRGSGFSYRIQFKRPGSFYLLELEYPDDADRVIEVVISSKTEGVWTNSQSGVGAETGGRFLPTGRMRTLRWIHVGDPGPHSVDVLNAVSGWNAAARRLRILRIKGDLPAVAAGTTRRYGTHTERCFFTSGVGMNFGVGYPVSPTVQRERDRKAPLAQTILRDLVWMEQTSDRYVQYLKFTGQNCHVMGCYQYAESNTPYVPAVLNDASRVRQCLKTVLSHVLDANDIDFYAGVEFSQFQDVRSYANNAQVARGADTVWMVDRHGRQRYGHRGITVVPNWLHPSVREKYTALLDDLCQTFGGLKHFRGVHGFLGPTIGAGYWIPAFGQDSRYDDPLVATYDDRTMARFSKDTGTELPVGPKAPDRFSRRAALLRVPALRARFLNWRCGLLREFLGNAVSRLRQHRSDLEFVNELAVEDRRFFQYLAERRTAVGAGRMPGTGSEFGRTMREFGIDIPRLGAVPGLSIGRWTLGWRQARPLSSQDPFSWMARTDPDVIAAFPPEAGRTVFVRTSWDENRFVAGGYKVKDKRDHDRLVAGDWIMNAEKIRALPQPGGFNAREALLQAIVTGDPVRVFGGFTDLNINVGHEQTIRELMLPFTHLPAGRFRPALGTGLDTDLTVRVLRTPQTAWFYAANPCPWPVRARLYIETPGAGTELVGGRRAFRRRRSGRHELSFELAPFTLRAWRVDAGELRIIRYEIDPLQGRDLQRLTRVADRVAALLDTPGTARRMAPADARFMRARLDLIRADLSARQYARAWARMTGRRFWSLWKDILERAPAPQDTTETPLLITGPRAPAGIHFDRARNCLRVIGYSEERPATIRDLAAADAQNGWGKVKQTGPQAWSVDAGLWIGDDSGRSTFFQIGDVRTPHATVTLHGTLWVWPPAPSAPRSDGLPSAINRLTLGDPKHSEVRPVLRFACSRPGEHGLYVGFRGTTADGKKALRRAGSLWVFHAAITAAIADSEHAWGGRDLTGTGDSPRWASPGWYAGDVRVADSVISWFEGCVAYGVDSGKFQRGMGMAGIGPNPKARIVRSTFEHGGAAVQNGTQYLEDCVLRDLQTAVAEGGALKARLVRCVFDGNRRNWTLGSLLSGGIVLDDCQVGPQKKPMEIRKNGRDRRTLARHGVPRYPEVRLRRTLRVKVLDKSGSPVDGAFVLVDCPNTADAAVNRAAITDATGLTPATVSDGATLVTALRFRATDTPRKPLVVRPWYRVQVWRAGKVRGTVRLEAGQPIPDPLVIRLDE